MRTTAAILLATIFLLISLIHFYWVLGGKWGLDSAMPDAMRNHVMTDSRRLGFIFVTLIVALGLLSVSCLYLILGGFIDSPLPAVYTRYASYAVIGIFILRAIGDFKYCGFFKRIKEGAFARNDTKYFSPLCLLIALLALVVVL